ncbi:hypothetical protein BCR35DRAFT_304628, partial [Leucosporidium creatinivorum]
MWRRKRTRWLSSLHNDALLLSSCSKTKKTTRMARMMDRAPQSLPARLRLPPSSPSPLPATASQRKKTSSPRAAQVPSPRLDILWGNATTSQNTQWLPVVVAYRIGAVLAALLGARRKLGIGSFNTSPTFSSMSMSNGVKRKGLRAMVHPHRPFSAPFPSLPQWWQSSKSSSCPLCRSL